MERKEERVMERQSIFKFNERVTTEAKDATYEFRGPVISVKNLEKKFGEHEVLKDISFDLFEGDVVCIIGSSGSGKSTLLRCINHLETPTSGQILYHGYPLTKDAQTINRFRSQVGMVFQQFNLFNNMTVFDNCMAGVHKVKKKKQGIFHRDLYEVSGKSRHGALCKSKTTPVIRWYETESGDRQGTCNGTGSIAF